MDGAKTVVVKTPQVALHGQLVRPKNSGGDKREPGLVLIPAFTNLGLRDAGRQARRFAQAGYPVLLISVRGGRGTGG